MVASRVCGVLWAAGSPLRSTALPLPGSRSSAVPLSRSPVARGPEFAVRAPVRPLARVGEHQPKLMQQLAVLGHSAQVPASRPFIARLVIMVRVIVLVVRFAG